MRKRKYQRNVGVMFSEDTYQRLLELTDNEEITMSKFIRDLVKKELDQIEEEEVNNG